MKQDNWEVGFEEGDLAVERELARWGICIYVVGKFNYSTTFPCYYARSLCDRVLGEDFPVKDLVPYPDSRHPKRLYCEKCQQSMEHVEYEVEKQFT